MRLTSFQVQIIKTTIERILGVPNQIWLFGSRTNDEQRGGDIDLLIETTDTLPNRATMICKLYGALMIALDEHKLDIVLKDAQTIDAPIFAIARRTGILL